MNCLKFILCVLFLVFGTVRGWASAAATLTNHNLVYFQIDALPTAIPTNVIMLTGNLTNWQKLVTNVICNPCLIINPTDNYVPYRINATTFGDSWWYYLANGMGIDTNIYFGPGTTNVLYRSGTDLWYDNPSADHIFGTTNSGSGGFAMMSIDSTGQGAKFQGGVSSAAFGIASGAVGLIAYNNNRIVPAATDIIDFGSDAGLWHDGYWIGTHYQFGYTDYTGANYARLAIFKADTNSPIVCDDQTLGVAGYARGFEFRTNSGVALKIAPDSKYTGTGTNFLSDDGTFKAGSGLGVTINPSDTYVPYRIDASTFGDSWWYYLANGMGIDTNIYFGPGTTNVLYRSGTDLYYTNSRPTGNVMLNFVNGTGQRSWIGTDQNGGVFGTAGNNSSWTTASQGLYQVPGYTAPGADNAMDWGTRGYNFKTIHERTNYVYGFHDNTDTNNVRTVQSMDGTLSVFNLTSVTNGVNAQVGGFSLQTNGVQVLRWYPGGIVEFGSTVGTNQLYPVGNDLYWNGVKINP